MPDSFHARQSELILGLSYMHQPLFLAFYLGMVFLAGYAFWEKNLVLGVFSGVMVFLLHLWETQTAALFRQYRGIFQLPGDESRSGPFVGAAQDSRAASHWPQEEKRVLSVLRPREYRGWDRRTCHHCAKSLEMLSRLCPHCGQKQRVLWPN